MRYLLFLLLLISSVTYSQSNVDFRADSARFYKNGGSMEVVIRNSTKDRTNGVLVNTGNGVTSFLKYLQIDSITAFRGRFDHQLVLPDDTLSYAPSSIVRTTTRLLAFAPNGSLYKLWNGVWSLVGAGDSSNVQILGDSAIVVNDDTLFVRPIQFETDFAPEYAFQDGDTIRLYPRQYIQDSVLITKSGDTIFFPNGDTLVVTGGSYDPDDVILNQYTAIENKRAWIDTLRAMRVRIEGLSNTPASSALFVNRSITSDISERAPIATFENLGNNAGTFAFSNEAHIRLKAGTSGVDRRRYILWTGFDGVDDWVMGINANDRGIWYSSNDTIHRINLAPTALGGGTEIRSASTGAVQINSFASGEVAAGTGGLEVWSGGLGNSVSHKFDSTQTVYTNDGDTLFRASEADGLYTRSYTGRLVRIVNATATRFEIEQSGRMGFGSSPSSAQEFYFQANNVPSSGSYYAIGNSLTYATAADNSSIIAAIGNTLSLSGTHRANLHGIFQSFNSTNTNTSTTLSGHTISLVHGGAAVIGSIKGLQVTWNTTNASGGTSGGAYGIQVSQPSVNATASVNVAYGIRVEQQKVGSQVLAGYNFYGASGQDRTYFAGQTAIGTNSYVNSAILQVNSTSQGFLPPRMTGSQAEAISSPAEGLMVYATDGSGTTITSKGWWGYDGSAWVKLN